MVRPPNRPVASIMHPPKTLKGQNSHKTTRSFLYSCNRVEQERPDAINGAALVSSTFPQQTKETTTADKRAQTCNDHSPFTVIHLPSRSRGTVASFSRSLLWTGLERESTPQSWRLLLPHTDQTGGTPSFRRQPKTWRDYVSKPPEKLQKCIQRQYTFLKDFFKLLIYLFVSLKNINPFIACAEDVTSKMNIIFIFY